MRRSHAATAIASLTSERDWARQVTDAAELFGWEWHAVRPMFDAKRKVYRTGTTGTLAKGWPDVELHKPGRETLYVELKAQDGRLSPDQRRVHEFLRSCGHTVYVWRPADLPEVLETLR